MMGTLGTTKTCTCGALSEGFNIGPTFHARGCPAYNPLLVVTAPDGTVLVELHSDGETVVNGDPGEAAQTFWNAVGVLAALAYEHGRASR